MGMAMAAVGCGMTMMGSPTVLGAGTDCNNYLDDRNELHTNNQGTVRIDHTFANGDSLTGRYSLSSENGFMPQNLPGFGSFHDNFSQHGSIAWTRVLSPPMVNIATVTASRLALRRNEQHANLNAIVGRPGTQRSGCGGAGACGSHCFLLQGSSA